MLKGLNVLLSFLLIGVFFYLISPEFTNKLRIFTTPDYAALLSIPFIVIAIYALTRFSRTSKLSSRDVLWVSIAAVTMGVFAVEIFYITAETARAILLAAYLASLGWIYTNYFNGRMQRKAHTMNVLVQLRNSTEFNRHKNLILSKFPFGHPVTTTDIPTLRADRATAASYGPDKVPTIESAYYVANYFEFISIGVLNGDLDDNMVRDTLRSIFVNWFNHLEPIIYDARKEDNGQTNMRIFRNYESLVEQYRHVVTT